MGGERVAQLVLFPAATGPAALTLHIDAADLLLHGTRVDLTHVATTIAFTQLADLEFPAEKIRHVEFICGCLTSFLSALTST